MACKLQYSISQWTVGKNSVLFPLFVPAVWEYEAYFLCRKLLVSYFLVGYGHISDHQIELIGFNFEIETKYIMTKWF